jgi:hypothetical protein
MSVISEAIEILNKESGVFAFLPAVNQFYFNWQHQDPGLKTYLITLGALFISAAAFNIISQVDFSQYLSPRDRDTQLSDWSKSDESNLNLREIVIVIIVGLFWFVSLVVSLSNLWEISGMNAVIPDILFGVSVLFVCLVITDLLFIAIFPAYSKDKNSR